MLLTFSTHANELNLSHYAAQREGAGIPVEAIKAEYIVLNSFLRFAKKEKSNFASNTIKQLEFADLFFTDDSSPSKARHKKLKSKTVWPKELLFHQLKPMRPLFHRSSGGQLELPQFAFQELLTPADIFRDKLAYLSKADPWDEKSPHHKWQLALSTALLEAKTELSGPFEIKIQKRTPGLRVLEIHVKGKGAGKLYTGAEFQKLLGHSLVKSLLFSAKNAEGGGLLLEGNGFGHGVGLNIDGSVEMARQGKKATEILEFYFPHANTALP